MKISRSAWGVMAVLFLVISLPAAAESADRIETLEAKAAAMEAELEALRTELRNVLKEKEESKPVASESVVVQDMREEVRRAVEVARSAEKSAQEWKDVAGVTHLAGYASADYIDPAGEPGFFTANFNPMFHYMYRDRILWESELEFEVNENGETEVGLEYSTIDLFLTDSLMIMAGKFLVPLGQFRQNIHPSWINKLPSVPVGFGHDGAAPSADVGLQLRGGIAVGDDARLGYAAFVGNGPTLEVEDGEIHGIGTEGVASNKNNENVFGGRVNFIPLPRLELGLSAATGKASIAESDGEEVENDPARSYDVFGFDASYQFGNVDLRGEFIQQKIGSQPTSLVTEGGTWKTWYAQGTYRFGDARWEAVARYGDYSSPHPEQSQEQFAIGINHLIAPHAILKLGYEFNDGLSGELTDADRLLFQIAYGF